MPRLASRGHTGAAPGSPKVFRSPTSGFPDMIDGVARWRTARDDHEKPAEEFPR